MKNALKAGGSLRLRRRYAAVAAFAVAAVTLAGCSATSSNPSNTSLAAAHGPLTVWVGSWWQPNVKALTAAFEKAHPKIKLNVETIPINNYQDKFTTAALGGTPPDLIDLDVGMLSSIASQHLLQPIAPFVKQAKIDPKAYAAAVWQASSYKKVLYGVPDHAYSSFMFYNKAMFTKAGIPFPTSSWTYDDFVKDAEALTGNGVYGYGMAADNGDAANVMDFVASCIWAKGGDFFNSAETKATINSPKAVAGLKLWADLYTKEKVTPPGTPNFQITRDVLPLFAANKVAMVSQGATAFLVLNGYKNLDYGMVTMPDKVNRGGGWTMGIPVGAKNPAAAKVFLKWYANPQIQGTYQPTTPGLTAANALKPWNQPQYAVSTAAFKDSRSLPQLANWTAMQTDIITELQKVLVGHETVKQAADTMESDLNSLLK